MKLYQQSEVFINNKISFQKDFWEGVYLDVNIVFLTNKFLEYQKDLFWEFVWEITDALSNYEDKTLKQFQEEFEEILQNMNSKLSTFSEKIEDVDKFDIRWSIQVFLGETYMWSMIWEVSTVILRNNQINYIVDNDNNEEDKIESFSDFIEWELEHKDQVVVFGARISDFIEKKELQSIVSEDLALKECLETIQNSIKERTDINQINFISLQEVEFDIVLKDSDIKEKLQKNMKYFTDAKDLIISYRYPISISIWFLVILWILYAFVWNLISSNTGNVIERDGEQIVVDFDIEDLQKDIELFRRIDAWSNEKIEKYNQIMDRLEILEDQWRWSHDVQELKSILNQEYYEWFNIILAENIEDNLSYEFTEEEKEEIGDMHTISYNDWIMVWWTDGVLLNAYTNDSRWTTVDFDLPVSIRWCGQNLLWNGMYCFSEEWDLINITSGWISSVTTQWWDFPDDITGVWTFWESNIYTIFNDDELNDQWIFINRYTNQPWSQNDFWAATEYQIEPDFYEQNTDVFATWFTNISIDWSFVTWSPKENSVFQFHRNDQTWYLDARKIPMHWWPDILSKWWENTQVLSYQWSRFVYTFDPDTNMFTVYRSTPYKTNTAFTMDYELNYFFSINFDEANIEVKSVYVDSWERSILYVLTEKWVVRYNLHNMMESFDS